MNELIKKLAEQAGAETWSRAPMRAVTGLAFTDENLEKFAELMIEKVHYVIVVGGVQDLDILLEHFGVEE